MWSNCKWAALWPAPCCAACLKKESKASSTKLKRSDNLILFIDEAHTIIGAGAALGTSSDAANMFKSALARGDMRIIGATTLSEYKEYIWRR